jgi:hypothetical protein
LEVCGISVNGIHCAFTDATPDDRPESSNNNTGMRSEESFYRSLR